MCAMLPRLRRLRSNFWMYWKKYTLAGAISLFLAFLRDILKALLEDRVIGGINASLDRNAPMAKRILTWIAEHPWLLVMLCVCGILLHAYLSSAQDRTATLEEEEKETDRGRRPATEERTSQIATASVETTTTATGTSPRIFVDVTPEYLASFYDQHMTIQANKLAEDYIGKWIKVAGRLGDVYPNQVVFAYKTFGVVVFMYFDMNKWKDRLSILKRGSRIEVNGQIQRVNAFEVHLENCELIDS